MALDEGLVNKAILIMQDRSPDPVSLADIYAYVETDYPFTDIQLQIHKQAAGQEEPNWMHDLRNLLHKKRSKGLLVNPKFSHWTIAKKMVSKVNLDVLFDASAKNASRIKSSRKKITNHRNGDKLEIRSSTIENIEIMRSIDGRIYKIPKKLFIERVNHLILCGGSVDFGVLHNWGAIESGIIAICSEISIEDGRIKFSN